MKKGIKQWIAVVIICCITLSGVRGPLSVAAEKGAFTNPIDFGSGGSFNKIWYKGNDHLDVYGTFKMPFRGYVTIGASKPLDDEGEVTGYSIYIYTPDGELIWDCSTSGQEQIPTPNYNYQVGLLTGDYIVRFKPRFTVESGDIESMLSVKTSESQTWEVESNDSFSKATLVTLGKKMTAVYCENIDCDKDYFKFKVRKGKKYKIMLGNHDKLESGTAICEVFNSKKKTIEDDDELLEDGRLSFKAKYTGYYYIRFRNDGYDKDIKYTILIKKK